MATASPACSTTRSTAVLLSAWMLAVLPAWAAAPDARPTDKATVACEAAAAETLRGLRGRAAQEVQFSAARRSAPPGADDASSATIAGNGSYRGASGGATAFSYTCAYDADTGKASGVVLRDARAGGATAAAQPAWEPDLTHLSPEACEAAAAAALKDKYPPVGRIAFDPDTRQLRPAPNARTSLEGRGRMERAAGMNSAPFSYRCVLETASGRVVSVTTRD